MRNLEKIPREEMVTYLRKELICCIGSADAPMTIPVLLSTFCANAEVDGTLEEWAKKLAYGSITAMLDSEEFGDIIEKRWTDMAKGAGNLGPRKVICYQVKRLPQIAHILTGIEESNEYLDKKKADKLRQIQIALNDPKWQQGIAEGKMRLLKCLFNLGAEEKQVYLADLHKEYKKEYGEEMTRKEVKKYFPTGNLSTIINEYMYNEVELWSEQNQSGLMGFQLRRTMAQIEAEYEEMAKKREEAKELEEEEERRKMETKKKRKNKKKKAKAPPPPPTNLRVIRIKTPPPPPKPKPAPILEKVLNRVDSFFTDMPQLKETINLNAKKLFSYKPRERSEEEERGKEEMKKWDDAEEEEEGEEDGEEKGEWGDQKNWDEKEEEEREWKNNRGGVKEQEMKKKKKSKYTTQIEGGEFTDSEVEEGGGGGGREEEENGLGFHLVTAPNVAMLANSPTVSSSSNRSNKLEKKEDPVKLDIEELKRQSDAKPLERMRLAMKRGKRDRDFEEQYKKRHEIREAVEGIFEETKRSGRRGKEEEERRERAQKLLAELEPKMRGKKRMVVEERKEDTKFVIAAMMGLMIWGHDQIGRSEAKNMLRLLFAEMYGDIEMDVAKFAGEYIKIANTVKGPHEEHLTIPDGKRGELCGETARLGRLFRHNNPEKERKKGDMPGRRTITIIGK